MADMTTRRDTPAIYADLQNRLLTGGFAPGAKLMPSVLQHEYGCSANTVRDVLLQLSKVGLADFAIQRGFRSSRVSAERRDGLARFRVMLEQEGAVRSMGRGGLPWEARLAAAHHSLIHIEAQIARRSEGAPYMDLWMEAEHNFHRTLIAECGVPPLIETFEGVYMQFIQQIHDLESRRVATHFHTVIEEHQAIVNAALGSDASALRAAIEAHHCRYFL